MVIMVMEIMVMDHNLWLPLFNHYQITINWRAKSRFRGVKRVSRVHFGREIPFSPPKITIRFSPLFGLRFKKINFSGDFGILMKTY